MVFSTTWPQLVATRTLLLVFAGWLGMTHAAAELVTFKFQAELLTDQSPTYPFPVGQQANGQYSFERTTAGTEPGGASGPTRYDNALTNFTVTLPGYGTGSGSGGLIALGDPVQTSGSFNFLSDNYHVFVPAAGITFTTFQGTSRLLTAIINMQDLDLEGLDSEELLAQPPRLGPFLDNHGPNYDSDNAELVLSFLHPGGFGSSVSFRLTSLVVPEPSSLGLTFVCALIAGSHRGTPLGRAACALGRAALREWQCGDRATGNIDLPRPSAPHFSPVRIASRCSAPP